MPSPTPQALPPLSRARMLEQLMARDSRDERRFLAAVKTTGIYCVASCPARKPKPENVEFFTSIAEVEAAGYRACLRCRPRERHGASQPHEGS